jgi:hypothetical protein
MDKHKKSSIESSESHNTHITITIFLSEVIFSKYNFYIKKHIKILIFSGFLISIYASSKNCMIFHHTYIYCQRSRGGKIANKLIFLIC